MTSGWCIICWCKRPDWYQFICGLSTWVRYLKWNYLTEGLANVWMNKWNREMIWKGCPTKIFHFPTRIWDIGGLGNSYFGILIGSFADSRWAYAIMNCPSCVIVGIVIGVVIIIICGQSSCSQVWSQKLYILHIYAHMPLVYAHELVSEYNLYFLNSSHFS